MCFGEGFKFVTYVLKSVTLNSCIIANYVINIRDSLYDGKFSLWMVEGVKIYFY